MLPRYCNIYRGADKSLARPGRKQARKHVRDERDFNNTETRAVIKLFFPARQGAKGNSRIELTKKVSRYVYFHRYYSITQLYRVFPNVLLLLLLLIIIIIIIIFVNCNWVVTRWQWLFYMYTKYEIDY